MNFFDAVAARRSVREFTTEKVPESVVDRALDAALLAPNSSNMQTWEFYWVKDQEKRQQLVAACLNQSAAKSAQEMVVAVANPSKWKAHNAEMLAALTKAGAPAQALKYYAKLMPFIYGMQVLAPVKWLLFNGMGLVKPTPRRPVTPRDRQEVCIKSTALGCQNFMLAVAAQGFDSCPHGGLRRGTRGPPFIAALGSAGSHGHGGRQTGAGRCLGRASAGGARAHRHPRVMPDLWFLGS